jgi:hypothetical protein
MVAVNRFATNPSGIHLFQQLFSTLHALRAALLYNGSSDNPFPERDRVLS